MAEADLVVASAAWTVWNAGHVLPRFQVEDRPLGRVTMRQMLLWRLRVTAGRCRDAAALAGLGALLAELAGVLAERWPEVGPMPLYPAFRAAGGAV